MVVFFNITGSNGKVGLWKIPLKSKILLGNGNYDERR